MIEKYEEQAEKWLERRGWGENPFTLRIQPEAFVGYDDQLKSLVRHVREGHKFALVIGATGSGKTTLLSLFRDEFSDDRDVIYAQKPPTSEELVSLMLEKYPLSLWEKIRGRAVNIHNLSEYVNSKSRSRILLLVDEAHEADVKDLEWLRTVTDHVDNMQLVLAGLSTLDEVLRRNLETLRSRVTTRVELVSLDESDVKELVRRRIETQGGSDIKPFSDTVIRQIYQRSGGFPREVLKMCDILVHEAIERDLDHIESLGIVTGSLTETSSSNVRVERDSDTSESRESETTSVTSAKEFLRDLPYKQRKVVKILAEEDNMYPSEVAEILGTDKYKTKQHAVRSVNNILRRLQKDDYVERESRGKGYVYSLTPRVKTVLVKA